jgi:hypothetical protein
MHFLDSQLWAEIAYTQDLKSEWAKDLFNCPEEFLDDRLKEEADFLRKLGFSHKVIIAYHHVLPLVLENEAISKFISYKDDIALRHALPEIVDEHEAVHYMRLEYRLSDEDAQSLLFLLKSILNNYE